MTAHHNWYHISKSTLCFWVHRFQFEADSLTHWGTFTNIVDRYTSFSGNQKYSSIYVIHKSDLSIREKDIEYIDIAVQKSY